MPSAKGPLFLQKIVDKLLPCLTTVKKSKLHTVDFLLLKKSHTCEEGGAHLTISFWHLFMNLKNKLLKKTVEVGQ